MPFLTFLLLIISLGLGLVPVYLLRRKAAARAQDFFVSSEPTPPGVIQNSSIAYSLQMATFGPLFAWGASGDLWPAIISSVSFGLGVYLIYILRRPLLAFLASALARDQSITVHAFIAQQHGNDVRVRLLASGLTIFALSAFTVGEASAVAALLKPMLWDNQFATNAFIYGMLLVVALYAIFAGNSGVMASAQLQLGIIYLGLFGSTFLLLYILISALPPMPPSGTFAVVFAAICCIVMIYYRGSRYIDTSPIMSSGNPDNNGFGRETLGGRLFTRLEKILNASISVFAVGVIVFAIMELYAQGLTTIIRDSTAALQTGTRMSIMGLLTVLLLPLFYPIVDITNWQRIAAFARDRDPNGTEPSWRRAAFRKIFRIYAIETPLVSLFMCMFGAIAVVSTATPGGSNVMAAFIEQLTAQENPVATVALSLLLVSVFAIALSTMSSLFSAGLCAIRYDILPSLWPEPAPGHAQVADQAITKRRAVMAGGGLYFVMVAALYFDNTYLQTSFMGSKFLALLFAFYCAQLSFVPLILGPIIGRTHSGFGTLSGRWALVILGLSAAIGVCVVTVYVTTGNESWLWAAIPACLGSGIVLYALARMWPGSSTGAS